MEHVNDCCFRGIYKGSLWEDDLYISVLKSELTVDITIVHLVTGYFAPLPFLL